uniref:GIY-YIG endonuclease n=1 Tax=Ramaria rubella TaxID=113071 RepID=UPI002237302A
NNNEITFEPSLFCINSFNLIKEHFIFEGFRDLSLFYEMGLFLGLGKLKLVFKDSFDLQLHNEKDKIRPLLSSDIPSVESYNHNNTLDVLNKAILSANVSNLVQDFINNNRNKKYDSYCSITIDADGLDTLLVPSGIPLNYKGQITSLRNQSGVYMIYQNGTSDCYIGSAINCANRMRSHRDQSRLNKVEHSKHLLYKLIVL